MLLSVSLMTRLSSIGIDSIVGRAKYAGVAAAAVAALWAAKPAQGGIITNSGPSMDVASQFDGINTWRYNTVNTSEAGDLYSLSRFELPYGSNMGVFEPFSDINGSEWAIEILPFKTIFTAEPDDYALGSGMEGLFGFRSLSPYTLDGIADGYTSEGERAQAEVTGPGIPEPDALSIFAAITAGASLYRRRGTEDRYK